MINIESLSDIDFERILKYGKASNRIGKYESKPFVELPYGVIKIEIPKLLNEENIQGAIELILKSQYEITDNLIFHGNEFLNFLIWIKEQIKFISDLENAYLYSEPEYELIAAGINRLNEFGEFATIDNLANGNILKYAEIEALPYFVVYQKLKLNKIRAEIEKSYNKIIEEKYKHKR